MTDLRETGSRSTKAYYLGLGIANLVTMFVPDAIVLGGSVMKSAPLFLDGIERHHSSKLPLWFRSTKPNSRWPRLEKVQISSAPPESGITDFRMLGVQGES